MRTDKSEKSQFFKLACQTRIREAKNTKDRANVLKGAEDASLSIAHAVESDNYLLSPSMNHLSNLSAEAIDQICQFPQYQVVWCWARKGRVSATKAKEMREVFQYASDVANTVHIDLNCDEILIDEVVARLVASLRGNTVELETLKSKMADLLFESSSFEGNKHTRDGLVEEKKFFGDREGALKVMMEVNTNYVEPRTSEGVEDRICSSIGLVIMKTFQFFCGSPDGYFDKNGVIEVKWGDQAIPLHGKQNHRGLSKYRNHEKWHHQIQHLLLVTGRTNGYFVLIARNGTKVVEHVIADSEWQCEHMRMGKMMFALAKTLIPDLYTGVGGEDAFTISTIL